MTATPPTLQTDQHGQPYLPHPDKVVRLGQAVQVTDDEAKTADGTVTGFIFDHDPVRVVVSPSGSEPAFYAEWGDIVVLPVRPGPRCSPEHIQTHGGNIDFWDEVHFERADGRLDYVNRATFRTVGHEPPSAVLTVGDLGVRRDEAVASAEHAWPGSARVPPLPHDHVFELHYIQEGPDKSVQLLLRDRTAEAGQPWHAPPVVYLADPRWLRWCLG